MIYVTCHICVEVGNDRGAEEGSLICGECRQRTLSILQEIGDLYEWIADANYLAGTREPASHYTKSRPPVSLHAVSLLDRRTRYRRKGDPVSAQRILWAWWCAIQEAQAWDPPAGPHDVVGLIHVIRGRMPWISRQPAVVRFARHMACVLHSLHQEVGANVKEDDL